MEDLSGGLPPPFLSDDFPLLPPSLRPPVTPPSNSIPSTGLLPTPPLPTRVPPPPTSTTQSPPSLWSDLFTRASTIPKNFPPPTISSDGIPIVKAPPSVLLKSSETLKDFIICYFFGEPPTHKKIFSDLNPIWGKKEAIQIRPYSSQSCLILIPDAAMRDWVLDIRFWSAGTVAFSTALWTPSATLSNQSLSSAPVWLALHNVPPQLWSLEGFEIIASGIGDPSKKPSSLPALGQGPPRVRAIVPLEQGPLPSTVIVEDDDGNQVPVEIQYMNLPPLCPTCSKYGHRAHRCLLRPRVSPPLKTSAPSSRNSSVRTSSVPAAVKSVQTQDLNVGASLESLGFSSNGPNSANGPNSSIQGPSSVPLQIHSQAHQSFPPSDSISQLGLSSNQAQTAPPQIQGPNTSDPASTSPLMSTTQVSTASPPVQPLNSDINYDQHQSDSAPPSSPLPDQFDSSDPVHSATTDNPPNHSATTDKPTHHSTVDINNFQPLTTTQNSPSTTTLPCDSPSPYATPTDYPSSPHRPPFTSPQLPSFTSLLRQLEDSHSPSSGNLGSTFQYPSPPHLPTSSLQSSFSSPAIHNSKPYNLRRCR